MAENPNEYFKQRRGLLWLWAGLLAGPLAWALAQQVAYLFVTFDCSYQKSMLVWPVMVLTLLLALGGGYASWQNWQRAGKAWPGEGGSALSRSQFMAVMGLLLSGFSFVVILAEWLPAFFYQCQR